MHYQPVQIVHIAQTPEIPDNYPSMAPAYPSELDGASELAKEALIRLYLRNTTRCQEQYENSCKMLSVELSPTELNDPLVRKYMVGEPYSYNNGKISVWFDGNGFGAGKFFQQIRENQAIEERGRLKDQRLKEDQQRLKDQERPATEAEFQ